jgi:hypothetical protein
MSSVSPVDCRLRPSCPHAVLLIVIYASAVAAVLHTRLPVALAGALALVLLASAVGDLRRGALRAGPRAVRRVRIDAAGWWLHRADGGTWGPARPVGARAWPRALTLVLRDTRGARQRLHVMQDATTGDALRRLRARALQDLTDGGP